MSAVVVEDDVVHYEVLGRGPGILFIHGWLGSWRYWIPVMQALSTRYRTYAIDLWGYGDSGKKSAKYGIDKQVELIGRFMDHLGVAKLALVGHGLGGTVALNFAAQHPELVARLMTINTPLTGAAIKPRFTTSSVDSLVDWLVGRGPGTEELIAETNKLDPAAIQQSLAYMAQADLMAKLNECTAPTLIVHGERDEAIDSGTEQGVEGIFKPNVHRIVFEGGRHFPMLDDPAKFNRLLADFLEAKDLQSLELKDEWKRRMR
jgi:pimeloyl-ACP methyl ester carboxylesterase